MIDKAIEFFKEEIIRLKKAPEINGCEMKPEWLENIQICSTAIEALKNQKDSKTKNAEVDKFTYCKCCENYELMTSNNQYFCNKYGGFVSETDFCSRGTCKKMAGDAK